MFMKYEFKFMTRKTAEEGAVSVQVFGYRIFLSHNGDISRI
jgi:hypothetical protein